MSHRDYVASTSAGSEERDKELESAMAKACATMAEMHPEHPLRCTLKDEAKMVLAIVAEEIVKDLLVPATWPPIRLTQEQHAAMMRDINATQPSST
eukprot:m.10848 g.10848  ORF g.10848 m.10848 type:complete len:96 (+) comp9692_c0_seq2:76-363(+)